MLEKGRARRREDAIERTKDRGRLDGGQTSRRVFARRSRDARGLGRDRSQFARSRRIAQRGQGVQSVRDAEEREQSKGQSFFREAVLLCCFHPAPTSPHRASALTGCREKSSCQRCLTRRPRRTRSRGACRGCRPGSTFKTRSVSMQPANLHPTTGRTRWPTPQLVARGTRCTSARRTDRPSRQDRRQAPDGTCQNHRPGSAQRSEARALVMPSLQDVRRSRPARSAMASRADCQQ